MTIHNQQSAIEDPDYIFWDSIANLLGMRCYGWTYRTSALFVDVENERITLNIDFWLAERIRRLTVKK